MTNLEQQLTDSRLFREVPAELFLREMNRAPRREIEPGEILIAPGTHNRTVHLILSGAVTIHLENRETPPIGEVGAGGIVGELSLISHRVTSAMVVCKDPATLLEIDEKQLWRLIDASPLVARNLLAILTGWITSVNGYVIDQRKQIDTLQDVARVDGLTGLFNRRWFDESLHRLLSPRILQHPLTLIMLDVDHFKQYNDLHGHAGGDQALRALAEVLKAAVRIQDVAARFGGEEFALILPDTGMEAATIVAERLRNTVAGMTIRDQEGTKLSGITISLGLAASHGESSPESLIQAADEKLYEAKHAGRNRVRA